MKCFRAPIRLSRAVRHVAPSTFGAKRWPQIFRYQIPAALAIHTDLDSWSMFFHALSSRASLRDSFAEH